ncbi:MAG: DUF222 domain-containing protein [Microthrixaceae bacterium]
MFDPAASEPEGVNGADPRGDRLEELRAGWAAETDDEQLIGGVSGLSDDQLLSRISRLERDRRRLDAATLEASAELAARGIPQRRNGHRPATFLAVEHHLDKAEAARRVRLGAFCRDFAALADALREERLTLAHVALVSSVTNTRNHDALHAAQHHLVDAAAGVRFERWADEVRALARHADPDGNEPRPDRRSLTWGRSGDLLRFRGQLTGDDATTFEHLLDTQADRLFRRARQVERAVSGELPAPTRPQLHADALVDLIRRGATTDDPTATFADISVVVPVDHPTLTGTTDHLDPLDPSWAAHDHGGRHIADLLLTPRLCTADITPVIVSVRGGEPLLVGSTRRLATRAQRRAARVRDGGCVFPGCDCPPNWCDQHHVVRPADGGRTDPDNLATLCRAHHGVVHSTGWRMRAHGGGRFTITSPRGRRLTCQRHGRPAPALE